MAVAGPGTRLLRHGEQSVGDVGQKAVKVEHVGLHWRSLRFRVHLIGPLLQLRLADLTLGWTKRAFKTPPNNFDEVTEKVTHHTDVRICCTNHPTGSLPTREYIPPVSPLSTPSLLQSRTRLFVLAFSPSLKTKTFRGEKALPSRLP